MAIFIILEPLLYAVDYGKILKQKILSNLGLAAYHVENGTGGKTVRNFYLQFFPFIYGSGTIGKLS